MNIKVKSIEKGELEPYSDHFRSALIEEAERLIDIAIELKKRNDFLDFNTAIMCIMEANNSDSLCTIITKLEDYYDMK